jgi:hypothetical protein
LTYNRTILAGEYASCCLPRDITVPTGVDVYELNEATDEAINFTKVTTGIKAYKPYLLHNVTSSAIVLSINGTKGNVELARGTGELSTTVGGVRFIGNFKRFTVNGTEGYAAFKNTGKLAWLDNEGAIVGSFRAYLADAPTGARLLFDDVTAIEQVKVASPWTDNCYYDLKGHRLSTNRPQQKGIYIYRGKTVVVK